LFVIRSGGDLDLVHVQPLLAAAVFGAALAPGAVHQDVPHRFGRRGEEVASSVPLLPFRADQPQPGFMDERGRLERVPGGLLGHFRTGQSSQLFIDQRQQILRRCGIAVLNCFKDACHVAHAPQSSGGKTGDNSKRFQALSQLNLQNFCPPMLKSVPDTLPVCQR
jgi:hypothetical protein